MLLRFALLLALSAGSLSAQITLRADQVVPPLGETTVTEFSIENEDGAATASIDALIAQSGANQTWDFTALVSQAETLTGTFTVESGATGPRSAESPFDQATRTTTLRFPPMMVDGETVTGTVRSYIREASDGLYTLGIVIVSEAGAQSFESSVKVTPDGALVAPPTYTFGTTWESTHVEDISLFGITNKRTESEVDGWGVMIVPGQSAPVPALRVRVTDTDLDANSVDVFYEFRTAAGVNANLDPDDSGFGFGPTASVTVPGATGTTAEDGAPDAAFSVGTPAPNPTTSRATILVQTSTPAEATVTVYDALGREAVAPVRQRVAGSRVVTLGVDGLAPGLYLVRVEADGQVATRTLTIAR
ncbi:MAG: T9SS type A sorting domain-containing protein [Bacteroidota bacterium]